jgi:hypothetical protein
MVLHTMIAGVLHKQLNCNAHFELHGWRRPSYTTACSAGLWLGRAACSLSKSTNPQLPQAGCTYLNTDISLVVHRLIVSRAGGMRQLHWHLNFDEWQYVINVSARQHKQLGNQRIAGTGACSVRRWPSALWWLAALDSASTELAIAFAVHV